MVDHLQVTTPHPQMGRGKREGYNVRVAFDKNCPMKMTVFLLIRLASNSAHLRTCSLPQPVVRAFSLSTRTQSLAQSPTQSLTHPHSLTCPLTRAITHRITHTRSHHSPPWCCWRRVQAEPRSSPGWCHQTCCGEGEEMPSAFSVSMLDSMQLDDNISSCSKHESRDD